jgi:hypothetical protein
MPSFLVDPPMWLYLVLGGALVITGGIAAQYQDRRTTLYFAVAFLLMAAVFLIDRFYESPREEAVRRIYLMQMAADAKRPDAFVDNVADTVLIQGGGEGKTLPRELIKRSPVWDVLSANKVSIGVWDFAREDVKELGNGAIEIGFMGKGIPEGVPPIPVYLRATFTRQPSGAYKLTALRTFEPIDRTKPMSVPGFF